MWQVRSFDENKRLHFTVVMNMVFQHLILEDTAELRQGLQVDDVDDERPEDIIQGQT